MSKDGNYYMEPKKTQNCQSNPGGEKKKEEGKLSQTSDNTTKLQSCSSQNSVVLVQSRHMDHWNRIDSPETHR